MMRTFVCVAMALAAASAARADDAAAAETLQGLKLTVKRDKNLPGEPVTEVFAPNLKESMKLEGLNKLGAEVKTWGAVENIGTPDVRPSGSGSVVTVPVKFATQNINFIISCFIA